MLQQSVSADDAGVSHLFSLLSQVFCGRYINEHMVTHGVVSEHPVVLSFSDLSVWCYLCEAYVHHQVTDLKVFDQNSTKYSAKIFFLTFFFISYFVLFRFCLKQKMLLTVPSLERGSLHGAERGRGYTRSGSGLS